MGALTLYELDDLLWRKLDEFADRCEAVARGRVSDESIAALVELTCRSEQLRQVREALHTIARQLTSEHDWGLHNVKLIAEAKRAVPDDADWDDRATAEAVDAEARGL